MGYELGYQLDLSQPQGTYICWEIAKVHERTTHNIIVFSTLLIFTLLSLT
jgi:hypothetical protein